MKSKRKPMLLVKGQFWDEISSAQVNANHRQIVEVGSKLVTYRDQTGREHTVQVKSFRKWARNFAETK